MVNIHIVAEFSRSEIEGNAPVLGERQSGSLHPNDVGKKQHCSVHTRLTVKSINTHQLMNISYCILSVTLPRLNEANPVKGCWLWSGL